MTHFLVIRLSSIGDIVHTLPAVAALGEAFPEAQIDWAIEPRYASLLQGNPFVRRVIQIDTLGWRARLGSMATVEEVVRATLEIRRASYDIALDFQGLIKSALIGWLSRSRERWGLTEYWLKEPLAGIFYTDRVGAIEGGHVIEESLALAERLISTWSALPELAQCLHDRTAWRFPLPDNAADNAYVQQALDAAGAGGIIVINPGGGWVAKRWAPENYAKLISRLGDELPWYFVLTGAPTEEPAIETILQQAKTNRAMYLPSTLTQFVCLAKRAKLFIGGDTGPLHLAAAVGTPIVGICGPTDPARNGPFSSDDIALTNADPVNHTRRGNRPSYLEGISVDSVLDAVRRRLGLAAKRDNA